MMCGTSYMARSALIVNWSQSVVNVMLQSLDRPGRAAPVVFFMPADVFGAILHKHLRVEDFWRTV